jgi:hypothetical protein
MSIGRKGKERDCTMEKEKRGEIEREGRSKERKIRKKKRK